MRQDTKAAAQVDSPRNSEDSALQTAMPSQCREIRRFAPSASAHRGPSMSQTLFQVLDMKGEESSGHALLVGGGWGVGAAAPATPVTDKPG